MSQTYSDVDASGDPGGAVAWQVRMSGWPVVQASKQRTYELLGAAELVVDVGCGPGVDATALGRRCIGLERSAAMAAAAMGRGVVVCRADAHQLPFADGTFGGARADRVLQHLADPGRALAEMVRVSADGGRIVVVDPDQATLVIRVPGVRSSLLERLQGLRRNIGYRNGTVITDAPALMAELGVVDITTEEWRRVLTDPDDAFGLPSWPESWRAEGGFTEEELAEWSKAIDRRPVDGFSYEVTFKVVAGTKSGHGLR